MFQIVCVMLCVLFFKCDHIVESLPEPEFTLPKVQIDIDQESYITLLNNCHADFYMPALAELDGLKYDVNMRHQGNVSRRYLRKSYKLKFSEDVLFRNRQSHAILSAQLRDHSFMRNHLSLKLFKTAGLLALETDLRVLFLNDEFEGIYLLMEPVDEYFFINRGMTPNNLYKAFESNARFTFKNGYQVRSGFDKKINKDENYSDLEDFILLLDTTPDSLLPDVLPAVLDVDNTLNYLAISVLIGNWDGYSHNFHLYHNPQTGCFQFIPYDLDMTFGNGGAVTFPINGYNHKEANVLFVRLLSCPVWREQYKKRLLWLIETVFNVDTLSCEMDILYQQLAADYEKDELLQRRGSDLVCEMEFIENYVQNRSEYVREALKDF